MKNRITCGVAVLMLFTLLSINAQAQKDGWVSLWDGKTFNNWKINEHPETFSIKDGAIVIFGERAHAFYDGPVNNHNFKNFEFKITVMTAPGANSGLFVHSAFQETGWPKQGYEIQVNQSHTDWRKTGSVYGLQDVKETFVKDNEWYTQQINVHGDKVTVLINGKVINEYVEKDPAKILTGTFALQAHDPKSKVMYKDIMVKPLPD